MRNIITYLVLNFSLISQNYAQFDFEPDKDYNSFYSNYLDDFNIESFDNENFFELRVWINSSLYPPDLLRLVFTKDSTWIAEKFVKERRNKKSKLEKIQLSNNWIAKWDSITKFGLLTLPDQMKVKDMWKGDMEIIAGDTIYGKIVIADGSGYTIELLTKDKQRKYSYHCPKTNRNFYKNVAELKQIVKILEMLMSEYKYPKEICIIDDILPPTGGILHCQLSFKRMLNCKFDIQSKNRLLLTAT